MVKIFGLNELELRFLVTTNLMIAAFITALTGILFIVDKSLKHTYPILDHMHVIAGVITVILAIIHFILNWKMYRNEVKIFFK